MNPLLEKIKHIQCLICDVDGVLTDGLIYLDNTDNEHKTFHIQDGLGLVLLKKVGIEVAIITGSKQSLIDKRMRQLGITHFYQGQRNKQAAYDELKATLNLDDHAFAYIGDDLPDLPIMQHVGFSVAVANAVPAVKHIADWQTTLSGGHGAVREVCDLILNTQEKDALALALFLAS